MGLAVDSKEVTFWSKVQKGLPSECWPWLAAKAAHGYGSFGKELAHRFAYELCVGKIPSGMVIDHLCHNPSCVNPGHLRVATKSQNQFNQLLKRTNTSGFKGVSWRKDRRKWEAAIRANHRRYKLGYFDDPHKAYEAYCKASRVLHGEFSNKGDQRGL